VRDVSIGNGAIRTLLCGRPIHDFVHMDVKKVRREPPIHTCTSRGIKLVQVSGLQTFHDVESCHAGSLKAAQYAFPGSGYCLKVGGDPSALYGTLLRSICKERCNLMASKSVLFSRKTSYKVMLYGECGASQ